MFRSENPEEDFRNVLEKRLSVDDLVYHGSLVAFHKNQLDRCADDMPLNDTALYHLINVGVRDMDAVDKPWDVSTRSMRYAACLGDRLWTMITREQNRVCVFCFFVLLSVRNMVFFEPFLAIFHDSLCCFTTPHSFLSVSLFKKSQYACY